VLGERVGGVDHRVRKAHRLAQHGDIFRLDFIVAQLDLEIGPHVAPPRRFGIERDDANLGREELFQPFGARAAFVGDFPAVVVVHVENQVDRLAAGDDARQQHARQEALAGAAFAKDADGTLDQPLEVEVDLRFFQFERRADVEVGRVLAAKHGVDVLDAGIEYRHEVARNGFDRTRGVFGVVNRQHGCGVQLAIGGSADIDIAQERVVDDFGRVALDSGIGAIERNVGDHAEETLVFAAHDDIAPNRQIFNRLLRVELDDQPFAERAADDHAEAHTLFSRIDGRAAARFPREPGFEVFYAVGRGHEQSSLPHAKP